MPESILVVGLPVELSLNTFKEITEAKVVVK